MTTLQAPCKTRLCLLARPIRYADGHYSIQCTHPDCDPNSTRDVAILEQCPLDTETQPKRGKNKH